MAKIYLLKPIAPVTGLCPDCGLEFILDVHRAAETASCPGCKRPFLLPLFENPPYMEAPAALHRGYPKIDLSKGD